MTDFNFFIPITKVSKNTDGSCTVSGYCTTPAIDLDGEIISLDAVKKAAPGYWEWRNIRRMHSSDAVGVGKELNIDEKGAFLTAKIVDANAVKGCLEGVYKGFSVGGKKIAKTGNTITEIDWIETSIVDRPANPECKFDVAKRAKDSKGAYLMKTRAPSDPMAKTLARLSKAALTLTKADNEPNPGPLAPTEPPRPNTAKDAGNDTEACAKHGIMNCAKCAAKAAKRAAKTEKREVGTKERQTLASEGNALPSGGFPIKDKGDLDNARRAFGRAGNKPATRRLIVRRARELGVKLPDKWTKKQARVFRVLMKGISPSASPPFLSLHKGAEDLAHDMDLWPLLLESGRLSPDSGNDGTKLRGSRVPNLENGLEDSNFLDLKREDLKMAKDIAKNDELEFSGLDGAILDIVKRSMQPSRAARMGIAQANLKKANKSRKAARDAIEEVHKTIKKSYLAKEALVKAGKKDPKDGDSDDMECFAKAMSGLQKAFGEINKMGTFMKASRDQLAKVGRSGQREQEPSHGEPGYKVPEGVMDLNPDELAAASPGTPGRRGSMPPAYPGSEGVEPQSVYAGKAAKLAKNGQLTPEVAALLAENARLEGRNSAVAHLPQSGRRPYGMDVTKFAQAGANNGRNEDPLFKAMKDAEVNPAHLMIEPEADGQEDPRRRNAVAKVVGQYLHPDSGNGRSAILDSSFKGRAA